MTQWTANAMNRRRMLADVGLVAVGGIALAAPALAAVRGTRADQGWAPT
jgi:hypothetical protein